MKVSVTKRRQSLGRDGEQEAARFLEARGYRIVARNVRAERVEIDLIARRGPLLVFVEVKSRRETGACGYGRHGAAAEAVDARKQARIRRGARAWLGENPEMRRRAKRLRFDVVTCLRSDRGIAPGSTVKLAPPEGTRWSIEHWQAAF